MHSDIKFRVVSLDRVGAQNGLQKARETRAIRAAGKSPTRYGDTSKFRLLASIASNQEAKHQLHNVPYKLESHIWFTFVSAGEFKRRSSNG